MKILTINDTQFDQLCVQLAENVLADFMPSAIVGIRTGGYIVAEKMHRRLIQDVTDLPLYSATASRISSKVKRKIDVSRLFRLFPVKILDVLRLVEHLILRLQMRMKSPIDRHIALKGDLISYIKEAKQGCVLIVDDAIDSGATVNGVVDQLRLINPSLSYVVAVLVVTQPSALIKPNVVLYHDVLLRFPWASDYK